MQLYLYVTVICVIIVYVLTVISLCVHRYMCMCFGSPGCFVHSCILMLLQEVRFLLYFCVQISVQKHVSKTVIF